MVMFDQPLFKARQLLLGFLFGALDGNDLLLALAGGWVSPQVKEDSVRGPVPLLDVAAHGVRSILVELKPNTTSAVIITADRCQWSCISLSHLKGHPAFM